MSKLQNLINELCPNGVKYVVLNSVCNVYDGTHQTPKYTDSGVKFISVENINSIYQTNKYISKENFQNIKAETEELDIEVRAVEKYIDYVDYTFLVNMVL